jgi:hypothetical protein
MVTKEKLGQLCKAINEACNAPSYPYIEVEGKPVEVIGHYHVSFAYGGVCLERTVSQSGGTVDVFNVGYTTRLVLSMLMQAYLQGIEIGKGLK